VRTCAKDGVTAIDSNTRNVCTGGGNPGSAYTCSNQQPFMQNGVLYGFVATQIGGCCDCFELQFKSTNRKMIVQRTNTGGDLSQNQFDIQVLSPPCPALPCPPSLRCALPASPVLI
jgi:hypothetical protein